MGKGGIRVKGLGRGGIRDAKGQSCLLEIVKYEVRFFFERFIPSHNIFKICSQNHCALQMLDLRSNMVITDLLPGAPLMFLLAILAAHPVYISV